MASTNPIFTSNSTFNINQSNKRSSDTQALEDMYRLEDAYSMPSATSHQAGRMTYDDVLMKTMMCFALVVVGAAVGWVFPSLSFVGAIIGLALGLYLGFTGKASKVLTLTYAAAEGVFIGAFSHILEVRFPGIALQAIIGTFSVFSACIYLYKTGKVRVTPKLQRIFSVALLGYFIFSMVNLLLMLTGTTTGMFGLHSANIPGTGIPFGLILGLLAVGLGAFSLVMDFQSIEYGVRTGAPAQMSWTAAFGLTMTMIWLYTEILRLLAILRQE